MERNMRRMIRGEWKWVIGWLVVMGSGCAPHVSQDPGEKGKKVLSGYLSGVTKYDGIDENEAVLIAKSELLFRGDEKNYYFDRPHVEAVGENAWQVWFEPVNKTLQEALESQGAVVTIDRKNGAVKFEK